MAMGNIKWIFGPNAMSVFILLGVAASAQAEIRFQEVTEDAGFNEGSILAPSWGACWALQRRLLAGYVGAASPLGSKVVPQQGRWHLHQYHG